jgi:hypothetical protein
MSHQAVTTKWIAPTNTKGSRIKAKCAAKTITVGWNHSMGVEENHRAAAKALIGQLEWFGEWVQGTLPDESGDCFVCAKRTRDAREVHIFHL